MARSQSATTKANKDEILSAPKALIFAVIGAFIASILESAVNVPSNSGKYGEAISRILGMNFSAVTDTVGILFVVFVAALIARTSEFRSEKAALTSGLMIFSTLVLLTPLKQDGVVLDPVQVGSIQALPKANNVETAELGLQYSGYLAVVSLDTNATVQNRDYAINVSSCKPSYYGVFGIGSLINNKIKTCPTKHNLDNGNRVKILSSWQTGLRGFYYAQIQYVKNGKIYQGWISQGTKSSPNLYLALDKTQLNT